MNTQSPLLLVPKTPQELAILLRASIELELKCRVVDELTNQTIKQDARIEILCNLLDKMLCIWESKFDSDEDAFMKMHPQCSDNDVKFLDPDNYSYPEMEDYILSARYLETLKGRRGHRISEAERVMNKLPF